MKTDYEVQLAQGYYEGGLTPRETEMGLFKNHAVVVAERTISKWARKYKWRHWNLAKLELLNNANPDLPFGVSKIKDPVFHDAEAIAKNWCRGEGYVKGGSIRPVIQGALREVIRQKEGVPVAVLDYLSKVVLRPFIKEIRKNNAFDPRVDIDPQRQAIIDAVPTVAGDDDEKEVGNESEPGLRDGAYRILMNPFPDSMPSQIVKPLAAETNEPLSEDEIPEEFWPLLQAQGWQPPVKDVNEDKEALPGLSQLLAQSLPIDEDHASLGMVYTNEDDDEAVNEEPQ